MSIVKCKCGNEAKPYKDGFGKTRCEKCGKIIDRADMVLVPPQDTEEEPEEPEHSL